MDTKIKYYRNYCGTEKKKETSTLDEDKEKIEKKPTKVFPKPPEFFLEDDTDDDAAANERRIKKLHSEKKRMTPDWEIVSGLLEKTYAYRRKQILEAPVMVDDLLKTFPFLSDFDQVCNCIGFFIYIKNNLIK